MPYVEDRVVHDADSHVVETPGWLVPYADPDVRERIPELNLRTVRPGEADEIEEQRRRHRDPEHVARDAGEIMLRKNWAATGSFLREDRGRALDLLGFSSQLVFNTFVTVQLVAAEHGGDLDLAYGLARAHNRAMVDFCSSDARLLPVGYVPLADFARSAAMANEALDQRCAALMVASRCPHGHSPSHLGLDAVWRQAEEAGIPVVLHVGGGGQLLDPAYFVNGGEAVPDFHGGSENFRSVDYMAIPFPPMQTLATLLIDGVLDRFPRLRIGVIEQGAIWLPSWIRQLDSALEAFSRHEERLKRLQLRPAEYVRRQVRVTPYPTEDAGWVVEQVGVEVCMFSSDYPHVEGGRNPLARFDASLRDVDESARSRFYADNFVDLMGAAMARVPAAPPVAARAHPAPAR
jgi:uncharacterized protein